MDQLYQFDCSPSNAPTNTRKRVGSSITSFSDMINPDKLIKCELFELTMGIKQKGTCK